MICSAAFHVPRAFLVGLLVLAIVSCNGASVMYQDKPVKNAALVAATQSVEIAELSAIALTNALTAAYEAGEAKRDVLLEFQRVVRPKVSAALTTARLALTAWAQSPGQSAEQTAGAALVALAEELKTLRGFWEVNDPAKIGAN